MKIKTIISLLATLAISTSAHATTMTFASAASNTFRNEAGASIGGSLIRVGTFAGGNAFVNANEQSLSALEGAFTQLGTDGQTTISAAGPTLNRASGSAQNNTLGFTALNGQKVYVWAFNAASAAAATQWAILESSTWSVFPTQAGGVGDTGSINMADANITALYGTISGGIINTQTVPEPSTYAAIFGVAVLGLAVLRRRVKKA